MAMDRYGIDVKAEARAIMGNTEEHAQLVERTAKAIFRGKHDPTVSTDEARVWESLWQEAAPEKRIRCRNQARAALAASELLKRIEELEQRISAARRELAYPGGGEARHLANAMDRAERVLSKQLPVPDPISIKP